MAFANLYGARVQSVQDLSYPIPVHTSFYPAFKTAAKKRIIKEWPAYSKIIKQAFKNSAADRTWGILLEKDGQPLLVIQNLSCIVRNSTFRRVLRINLNEAPVQRNPLVWDRAQFARGFQQSNELTDTLNLVHNNQMNEGSDPSISVMNGP